MQKKKFFKHLTAGLLALSLLVGVMPAHALAADQPVESDTGNQLKSMPVTPVPGSKTIATRAVQAADWDIENQEDGNFWPLAQRNELLKVSPISEPYRGPDIKYVGVYKNAAGQDVLRLQFRKYNGALSDIWRRLVVKFDQELYDQIEWNNPQTGYYSGSGTLGDQWNVSHDAYYGNKNPFSPVVKSNSGGSATVEADIYGTNNFATFMSTFTPMDFVLKEGGLNEVKNKELLVQARLTDDKYVRVYTNSSNASDTTSYGAYTMSTVIPFNYVYEIESNPDLALTLGNLVNVNRSPVKSASSYIVYNENEGYVDVFHKQVKRSLSDYIGNGADKAPLGFRQAVNKEFYELLQPNDDGTVAIMTIADKEDKLYKSGSDNGKSPLENPKKTITFKKVAGASDNQINVIGDVGFIQAAGNNWDVAQDYNDGIKTAITNGNVNDIIINGADSMGNSGVSTMVRYYVNKDKLNALIKEDGLENYAFYSAVIRQDPIGTLVFNGETKKEIKLTKNQEISLDFNYNANQGYERELTIGTKPYSINFINSITRSNDQKYIWKVPFDMTIPAGTLITFKTVNNPKAIDPTLTITGTASDFGSFSMGKGQVSHLPRVLRGSDTLTGGAIIATNYIVSVDELFTGDKKITGDSFYETAEITINTPNADSTGLVEQKLSSSNKKGKVTLRYFDKKTNKVVEKEYESYKFDTGNVNPASKEQLNQYEPFVMPANLIKDMPILVSNKDVLAQSSDSRDVVEQVQSRVYFHYNNQTRDKEETVAAKILPLNEEYTHTLEGKANPAYKPSGFLGYKDAQGANHDNLRKYEGVLADHTGLALEGNKLKARQMPVTDGKNPEVTKEDLKPGEKFLGWSTKKGTTAEEFRQAEELTKLDQWQNASTKAYKFTGYSPAAIDQHVYAVWGQGAELKLHGNKDGQDQEVYSTTITEKDLVYQADGSPFVIDGKKYAKLPIPKVFYTRDKAGELTGEEKTYFMKGYSDDEKAGNFVTANDDGKLTKDGQILSDEEVTKLLNSYKDRYTFVGWTSGNDQAAIDGNMTLYNNKVIDGVLDQKPIENKINRDKASIEYGRALLPNGGNLLIPVNDATGKASLDADIDLYAQYRPYYRVQIQKKTFDKNGQEVPLNQASSGSRPDAISSPTVQIGLLHRTAVTELANPTVDEAADYYPISKNDYGTSALGLYMQYYAGFNPNPTDSFNWYVPGYDEYGQRLSYVGVELPVSATKSNFLAKTKANLAQYYAFYRDWNSLGATLLPRTSEDSADKYPGQRGQAKIQTLLVDRTHYGDRKVDTFTGATQRLPVAKETAGKNIKDYTDQELKAAWQNYIDRGKYEVYGYNIVMTNREVDKYQPNIEPVQEGAKSFTMTNFFKDDQHDIDIEKIKGAQIEIKPKANSDEGKRVYHLDYNPNSGNLIFVADDVWRKTSADKDNSGLPTGDIKKAPATGNLPTIEYQKGSRAVTITMPADFPGFEANTAAFNENPNVYVKVAYRFNDTKADFYTPFTRRVDGINPTAKVSVDPESLAQQPSIFDKDLEQSGLDGRTEVDKNQDIIEANNPTHYVVEAKVPDPLLEKPAQGKTSYYLYRTKDLPVDKDEKGKLIDLSYVAKEGGEGYVQPLASYKMEDRNNPIRFVGPISEISRMVQDPDNAGKEIQEDDDLVILAVEEGKPSAKSDPFKLDLEAPKLDFTAQDDNWRLFVDLLAEPSKDKAGRRVSDAKGTVYLKIKDKVEEYTMKEDFIKRITALERKNVDMKTVTLVAYDEFNNKLVKHPDYTATKETYVQAEEPILGVDVVFAASEAGNTITAKVRAGGDKGEVVATGTVTVSDTEMNIIELQTPTGELYELQDGDIVEFKATSPNGAYSNFLYLEAR